jgi:membrane protein implicated in regulation of membrane protease activity
VELLAGPVPQLRTFGFRGLVRRTQGVTAVFLVIGALGLLVLVISLFAGELGDLGLGDLGLSDGDADGPFSVPAIAALLGGIGFGGAAAASVLPGDLPDVATALVAAAVGIAVAVPLAWGAVRLSRALEDMPTQETLTRDHLVGTQGVVLSAVPSAGFGEVRLAVAGQHLKLAARSDLALPAGTPVYVVEALSDTAVEVVSTAENPPHPLPEPGGTAP